MALDHFAIGSLKLFVIKRGLGPNYTSLGNVTKNMKAFFRNLNLSGFENGVNPFMTEAVII